MNKTQGVDQQGHTDEAGHDTANSGGDTEQMSDAVGIEKLVLKARTSNGDSEAA